MPGGDRTGPAGFGPMTGRGAGFCAGYPIPGFMRSAWGRGRGGRGRGCGNGWGHRHWNYSTRVPGGQRTFVGWPGYAPHFPAAFDPLMTKEQELEALKNQAKYYERALDDLRNHISEVESAESSKTT